MIMKIKEELKECVDLKRGLMEKIEKNDNLFLAIEGKI